MNRTNLILEGRPIDRVLAVCENAVDDYMKASRHSGDMQWLTDFRECGKKVKEMARKLDVLNDEEKSPDPNKFLSLAKADALDIHNPYICIQRMYQIAKIIPRTPEDIFKPYIERTIKLFNTGDYEEVFSKFELSAFGKNILNKSLLKAIG